MVQSSDSRQRPHFHVMWCERSPTAYVLFIILTLFKAHHTPALSSHHARNGKERACVHHRSRSKRPQRMQTSPPSRLWSGSLWIQLRHRRCVGPHFGLHQTSVSECFLSVLGLPMAQKCDRAIPRPPSGLTSFVQLVALAWGLSWLIYIYVQLEC